MALFCSGSSSAAWASIPPNRYRPSPSRFGHGASTWPRPACAHSSGPEAGHDLGRSPTREAPAGSRRPRSTTARCAPVSDLPLRPGDRARPRPGPRSLGKGSGRRSGRARCHREKGAPGRSGPNRRRYRTGRVRILVTNDDGVHAPGLSALGPRASPAGRPRRGHELVVVAPLANYSGASAAVGTVYERESVGFRRIHIEGAEVGPDLRTRRAAGPDRDHRGLRRLRPPARPGRLGDQPRGQRRPVGPALRDRRRRADGRPARPPGAGRLDALTAPPPPLGHGDGRRRSAVAPGRRRPRRPGRCST